MKRIAKIAIEFFVAYIMFEGGMFYGKTADCTTVPAIFYIISCLTFFLFAYAMLYAIYSTLVLIECYYRRMRIERISKAKKAN